MKFTIFRRILGLTVIGLIIAVAASQVLLALAQPGSNCATSSPSSRRYTVTVCIIAPAVNSTVTGNVGVTATATITGPSTGVSKLVFYLDGTYLLTDFQPPFTFELPSRQFTDAVRNLSVRAEMRDGFISNAAIVGLRFANGVTQPPVNTNTFIPRAPVAPALPFVVAAVGDGASGETSAVTDRIASWNPGMFLYLGDVYERGTYTEFHNWYGTATTYFGRFRSITNPVVGNHEHQNGIDDGYRSYWNNVPYYYSYNAAGWHFIALNSDSTAQTAPGSPQYQWLAQDLANNTAFCTIAYFHHPVYSVGTHGNTTALNAIWGLLAQNGVDVVLTAHDHNYQRWRPLNASGTANPQGITEFVVGGGGHGIRSFVRRDSRMVQGFDTPPNGLGALRMELNVADMAFQYISAAGSVLDSGTIPCQPSARIVPLPPGLHDERNANISYSGGWIRYNGPGPSGNTVTYTNVQNAVAHFSFTGSGIVLHRTLASNRGPMEVCIDTACQTINSNNPTLQWNVPVTIDLGTSATRTVRISNLSTSYIDLDAVRVLTPTFPLAAGFYQQTDPNISYLGNWISATNPSFNGGSLIYSNDPTAQATFKINGDALTLYRTRYTNRGPMQVCIDAACQTINNTVGTLQWNVPITFDNLGAGVHTIAIRNLSSSYIDLDAIRVGSTPAAFGPGVYDERDTRFTYNGLWYSYNGAGPQNNTLLYSNTPGDEIRFRFTGQAFRLYRTTAFNRGSMQVCINATCQTIDNNSPSIVWSVPMLFGNPSAGTYTVVIRHTGSSAQYIDLDGIEVFASTPISLVVPGITPTVIPTLVEVTPTPAPTEATLTDLPPVSETPVETPVPTLEASPEPTATPLPTEVPTETVVPSPEPTQVPPTPEPAAAALPIDIPTETPVAG